MQSLHITPHSINVSSLTVYALSRWIEHVEQTYPFDAHCCHMGTTIKHPVPDRVKLSFVTFDIEAL